ncbi:hypothetical protein [Pseudomonas gingeri]|uniref:hypothetical protein n=1 Tax=Pseudomonas gingeri TaxID=117681 RepID=UPI00159FAE71|nr:hypothetical protein [Pseudomonas gingeri]NWD05541.1 hypothetical protein [Pseudomonas gingeri]NWE36953.1 hypothetical protein [Pseudomonas gingeri]NWE61109.1 hypothetical protein [Pseudomonas gingeri]NWF05916.1 hypothetical protein [Pseudomonas gingeri]
METVTLWGYNVKTSDVIAAMALLVAIAAAWTSWLAYRMNLNSLSLYEGSDQRCTVLYITNNSPHPVTVLGFGYVGPDGYSSSLVGEEGLKIRIDPRDDASIDVRTAQSFRLQCAKGDYSRHCLYIVLATGHKFYNASRAKRWSWWLLGWFDGSRRHRIRRSEL